MIILTTRFILVVLSLLLVMVFLNVVSDYQIVVSFRPIYFLLQLATIIYNHFHNILRLFDVLLNFPSTTSETMRDYYL